MRREALWLRGLLRGSVSLHTEGGVADLLHAVFCLQRALMAGCIVSVRRAACGGASSVLSCSFARLNTPLVVIARQGTSFHGLSLHQDVEAGSQASSWRRAPEGVKYRFYNVQCACSSYAHTAMPFLVCLAGSWTVLPPRRWAVPRRVGRDLSLGTAHDGDAYAARRNPPFLCRTMPAASPRVAAPPWRAPARGSRGCGTTSDASFFSPLAHAAPHESSVSAILHCFMYMSSSRDAIPGRQRHSLGQRTPHFRARTS